MPSTADVQTQLQALDRLSQSSPTELDRFLGRLLRLARAQLDADRVRLLLVDDSQLVLRAAADRNDPPAHDESAEPAETSDSGAWQSPAEQAGLVGVDDRERRLPLSGYLGRAVDEVRAVVVPDLEHETNGDEPRGRDAPEPHRGARGARAAGGVSAVLRAVDVRALVAMPLRDADRTIGLVCVWSRTPRQFSSHELLLLQVVAEKAGSAIQRANLAAALQRKEAETLALRELDRLKGELIGTLSHELRTPLTTLYGYAQLLTAEAEARPDAVRVGRLARRILESARQLRRLVLDLVEYDEIERGRVPLAPVDIDLAPLLREIAVEFQDQLRRSGGRRLVARVPERLLVHADPGRVRQIVANLLENALKYAPESAIVLRARGAPGAVRVTVEDRGPGIPEDELQRVWERLYRGRRVAELNVARGSGIGLALVRQLVEAQGGRVGVESAVGLGSRFWFELPAAASGGRSRAQRSNSRSS